MKTSLEMLSCLLARAAEKQVMLELIQGLLTPQEIEEVQRRWYLLNRLADNQPQREIARELGISLGKIARGSRMLKYNQPGFAAVIATLREQGENDE